MANGRLRDFAFDRHAAATDEQPIEREAAAVRAFDGQRVGPVRVPVEQAYHRALAACRAQLQALALLEPHVYLLDVDAAVGDLDDRVLCRGILLVLRGVLLAPLSQRGVDGVEWAFRADAVQLVLLRLRQRAAATTAASTSPSWTAHSTSCSNPGANWAKKAARCWSPRSALGSRNISSLPDAAATCAI